MPKVTIGAAKGLVQTTGGGLVLGDGNLTTFTGNDASATIPVGNPYVQIDGNGARTGMRFASAGVAGETIVISNVGGENVTFDNDTSVSSLIILSYVLGLGLAECK